MDSTVITREAADSFAPGALLFGKYRVEGVLGSGGMGTVYRVLNERLGRPFAIKTVAETVAYHPGWLERFRREAELCARLRHPNIIDVIDWEILDDGRPCLVMELLEGIDLDERLQKGPLSWREIRDISGQILAGVEAAHAEGIAHRDLKPKNIFLTRVGKQQIVKLLDFGLAKGVDQRTVTAAGEPIGTPAYMSPEQVAGDSGGIGPATDLWAIGVILYEMVTGRRPFSGASMPQIFLQIHDAEPVSMSGLRPDVSPALEELVTAMLRKRARECPASVAWVASALERILLDLERPAPAPGTQRPMVAPSVSPVYEQADVPVPWLARSWPLAAATGFVVAALAAALLVRSGSPEAGEGATGASSGTVAPAPPRSEAAVAAPGSTPPPTLAPLEGPAPDVASVDGAAPPPAATVSAETAAVGERPAEATTSKRKRRKRARDRRPRDRDDAADTADRNVGDPIDPGF